ncbi:DUF6429 family protein [Cupriavidus sp. IDO]|uniref:DUF6429 family protein n=1 Tax=Cupriavidus sp. IDO TaxID=1539142 RepID=UPI003FCED5A4
MNLCEEIRACKSFDWDVLNRLHEKGLIGDPVNRAKSVWLTEVIVLRTFCAKSGANESECRLLQRLTGYPVPRDR